MDSFFGIGISELFFIAVIALIVLGPERLPGALREVGKFMRTIRSMTNELTSQFGDEIKMLDDLNPQKILRELTDDPEEKAKAAKAATTAKSAAKPAAKTGTSSTTKPATPKPATPKPTTPKPATTKPATATTTKPAPPKTTSATATSKSVAKPAGEEAIATVEETMVAVEDAPVAEMLSTESATLDTTPLESVEAAATGVVAPVLAAEAAVVMEESLAVAADEEYSILPPARSEELAIGHVDVFPYPGPPAEEAPAEEPLAAVAPEESRTVAVVDDSVAVEPMVVEDMAMEPVVELPTDTSTDGAAPEMTSEVVEAEALELDTLEPEDSEEVITETASEVLPEPSRERKVASLNVNGAGANNTSAESEP